MTIEEPGLPAETAPTAPREARGTDWTFVFNGEGGELFGILFLNAILNFLTLGIWYAWGRIRELQFLIGNTVVGSDTMSFHGRGGELLRGVIIAFVVLLVPIYVMFWYAGSDPEGGRLFWVLPAYALIVLLVGYASVGTLRYRLPRTEWRGIRFGFDGRPLAFLGGYLPRILLVGVSLGLAYPVYATWRRKWMLDHARFGSARFEFDGEVQPLYGRFLVCWLLGLPTLGWSWVHYMGYQQAYFWNHTRLHGAAFSTSMTGSSWLGLHLENAVLALFTFGIATPWILVRTHRYFLRHLQLDRSLDLASIQQQRQRTGSVGEGMLDVLDVHSGIDLG